MKRKKLLNLILIILGAIILLIIILFVVLWVNSPGKIKPLTDEDGNKINGSVSEIVRMPIGGVEQDMIIQGVSTENPVLLFLHGGPGNPEYIMTKESSLNLEESFTVCWD